MSEQIKHGDTVTSRQEHHNDDYGRIHLCCPHCFESCDYDECGDSDDEAMAIKCENCGKLFAGWTETIERCASGLIEDKAS